MLIRVGRNPKLGNAFKGFILGNIGYAKVVVIVDDGKGANFAVKSF